LLNEVTALQSTFNEFDDREGAPSRSHSSSFDQRRRPDMLSCLSGGGP
jgi:hypothetical protein